MKAPRAEPAGLRPLRSGERWGVEVPLAYGPPGIEARAVRGGLALVDLSWRGRFRLTGADRVRLLNGLVTCDVKGLSTGGAVDGFFTDVKGRILGDATIWARPDELWLELPPGRTEALTEHLLHYRIADRAEVEALDDQRPFALLGPGVAAVGPENGAVLELDVGSVPVTRTSWWGLSAIRGWLPTETFDAAWRELVEGLGAVPVGLDALEAIRVERGVPIFPDDFGPDHFPQETGLEARTVSYEKGCYLGQEVVARIHYRGQANRGIRRVRLVGVSESPVGADLTLDGRPVGRISSAAHAPDLGPIGLATLHRRAWEEGCRLEVAGGGTAETLPPPPPLP